MLLASLDLDTGGLLLAGAAVLLGGYARGYSGFGSAAIIMAVCTLILPPQEVVPVAIALEIAAGAMQLPGMRHAIDWRLLAVILAGALIGNPIGIKTLQWIDPDPLRMLLRLGHDVGDDRQANDGGQQVLQHGSVLTRKRFDHGPPNHGGIRRHVVTSLSCRKAWIRTDRLAGSGRRPGVAWQVGANAS